MLRWHPTAIRLIGMVFLLALTGCVSGKSVETEHIRLTYSDIDDATAQDFALVAERAYTDVTGYLQKGKPEKVFIDVSRRHRIPFTRANGPFIDIPANRVLSVASSVAHEMAHVVAPSRGKRDRLLDEGLGVYVQEKFGEIGDVSYPTFGRELHRESVSELERIGVAVPLRDAERLRTKGGTRGDARRAAYLVEGSFVKFLIETYGLEIFLEVHDGGTYDGAYGKSRDALEGEWQAFLASLS
jgi:hypothetical protein